MSSVYGPIILGLIFLSILAPLILVPTLSLWYTSGILMLFFGLSIVILAAVWYRSQKSQNLSVTLPAVSLAIGILIVIIGLALIGLRYTTRIYEFTTTGEVPALTFEQCAESIGKVEPGGFTDKECRKFYEEELFKYSDCKEKVATGAITGVNPPIIQRDITLLDSCQSGCKRDYQKDSTFPLEDCLVDCRSKTNCLKYPGLGPVLR